MSITLRSATASVLLGAAIVSAGCASSGAVPRPFPVPGGAEPTTGPSSPATPVDGVPEAESVPVLVGEAEAVAVASTALSLRGAPYRNGGTSPAGFDCSGFVQYVYRQHGLSVPRETRQQFRLGRSLRPEDLAPGDLVFFTTVAPGASHVGIVIGDDQFVHAPSERGVVRIDRLSTEYWKRRYVGARRPR